MGNRGVVGAKLLDRAALNCQFIVERLALDGPIEPVHA